MSIVPFNAVAVRPLPWRLARSFLLLLAGTAFLAASARIAIPLPFTPVPVTAQTLAVLLLGALYGPRLAPATVLAYLAEGAAGLPVFAGAAGGLAVLAGPTGGYLVGFVVAAWLVGGLLVRSRGQSPLAAVAAFLLGDAALMLLGFLWLAHLAGVSAALVGGVLPFLPGEVLKIAVASAAASSGRRLLGSEHL